MTEPRTDGTRGATRGRVATAQLGGQTKWNDGLVGPALDFAASDDRLIRVLAGPGTGKTFALIRRVARLLESGVDPDRILVLTFARTAAADLVVALRKLGEAGYREVKAQTLHSFCFSLLWRQGVLLATARTPRIVMEFERDYALVDLDGAFGGLRDRRKVAVDFESAWARRQTDEPGQPVEGLDQAFQDELLSWLRWHQAMLIGELVPIALSYLRHNPQSSELTAYDHVLVDEYQDLNRAEQGLIDLLGEHGSLAVVGDDDQSIYSFKSAHPEGIRTFDTTHPGTVDVKLELCRRCPTGVVELARTLVERDLARLGRRLDPDPGNPVGEIHNVQWGSMASEAEGIATYIKSQIESGTEPGEVLVLTSSRPIGQGIRDAMRALDIPTVSYFREEPVQSRHAQDALTLLTLLVDPTDRVALRVWLGFGSGDFRRGGYGRVLREAQRHGQDVAATLAELDAGKITFPYTGTILERWRELKRQRDTLTPLLADLPALVDRQLPEGNPDLAQLRVLARSALERDDQDAQGLVSQIRSTIAQPEVPIESEEARVMSFHKSKGLTAEVVVLAGLVDGLMPWADDAAAPPEAQAADRGEQRRLFYVGMTRTRRALVFSSEAELPAAMVNRYGIPHGRWGGKGYRTLASPFLGELGPTLPRAVRGETWNP